VNVEVAHVLVLRLDGRDWTQRHVAEERHLDVLREAMEGKEPALALDALEGRVPPHGLAHVGHGAHDERVEVAPDVAFPARHGGDVGLHGGVPIGLHDLGVAACEEGWLRGRQGVLARCCSGSLAFARRPLGFRRGGFPLTSNVSTCQTG
jgi:hypothetical protein